MLFILYNIITPKKQIYCVEIEKKLNYFIKNAFIYIFFVTFAS